MAEREAAIHGGQMRVAFSEIVLPTATLTRR
jgi:hypothetical protein